MGDKTQIHVQVDSDRKTRWERAAKESPEFGSLSGLIRGAVESHLAGDNGDNGDGLTEGFADLETGHRQIQKRLRNIQNDVADIRREVSEEPDVAELANEAFDLLPDVEPGSREWEQEMEARVNERENAERVDRRDVEPARNRELAWTGSVSGLADVLGESEPRVRDALEKLQSDMTAIIRTVEYDGETRFYRRE